VFQYAESNYFPCIETWELITFRVFDGRSKTEFTNNSLKLPKIGILNIDTLIIPQGLLIHEKNPDQKISCNCPVKPIGHIVSVFTKRCNTFTDCPTQPGCEPSKWCNCKNRRCVDSPGPIGMSNYYRQLHFWSCNWPLKVFLKCWQPSKILKWVFS